MSEGVEIGDASRWMKTNKIGKMKKSMKSSW